MKKIAFILVIAVLPVCMLGQNRSINKFYEKYDGQEGITSLNISGSLLHMIFDGKHDEETRAEINKLTGLRMIASGKEGTRIRPGDVQSLRSMLLQDRYEELMQIRDGKTRVNFVAHEERGKITELVMLVDDPESFLLLSFTGELDPRKLEKTFQDIDIDGGEYLQQLDNK